jgi:Nucleoside recognition.
MVNYIWVFMFVAGILYSLMNGKMEEVNQAIFQGAKEGVTLCIGFISILVFWLGLMRIARDSGLLDKMTRLFHPLVRRLFPDIPDNHPAMGYILSNMVANLFGLGNAATPLGIKAMEQLKNLNGEQDRASRAMTTFLVLNTTGLTFIPTTVLAIRMNYGSVSPAEIVFPTLLATICSTAGGVAIDRFLHYRGKK